MPEKLIKQKVGKGKIFLPLRNFLKSLINLVYPRACIVCKQRLNAPVSTDTIVCLSCWEKIKKNLPPFCARCGRHLEKKNIAKTICPTCIKKQVHFDRAFSPLVYEGTTKELIHAFKYRGREYLGTLLSTLLIDFVKEYQLPAEYMDVIMPIPLHKTRLREREYNQALILSSYLGKALGKEVLNNVLVRHRFTKSQTELELSHRLENVKDSFVVVNTPAIRGKNILLVDDVLTTGATCSEAACVLKNAGANIVFVLTLAN